MQGTEGFAEETASVLRKKLGNGYKVRKLTVEKINKGKVYALLITDGENMVSPAFYLESFYSRHISYGYTAAETAESIIKEYNSIEGLIKEDRNLALNLSRKEWVKERLFLVLINKDKNKDFLSDAVYSEYAGLALVLYVLAGDGMDGMAKIKVTKSMCRGFGWDEKDTAGYVLENTARLLPVGLCPLEKLINRLLNSEDGGVQPAGGSIPGCKGEWLVMSNQKGIYGAAAIFYPGILKRLAERKGTSLFLIPSSIHEFIIIPDNGLYNPRDLKDMLREVNRTEVSLDETLSDNLYYYSYEKGELSVLNAGNTETVIL